MNKNYNIQRNKNYKKFSENMEMNTKKNQLPFSQFLLNYENYVKFALLCLIMKRFKKAQHGNYL